jgi:hypothetical protein
MAHLCQTPGRRASDEEDARSGLPGG